MFERQEYVEQLVAKIGNGLMKKVTSGRRCDKSFLLFSLFYNHLPVSGVDCTAKKIEEQEEKQKTERRTLAFKYRVCLLPPPYKG